MPNVEEILLTRASPLTCYTCHSLMKAVGKSYVLQGQHPITVFAPSDAAFNALHEGVVYDLLKDTEKLESLVNFYLVPMKLTTPEITTLAAQLAEQEAEIMPNVGRVVVTTRPITLQVETLSGYPLTLTLTNTLHVNGAKVEEPDLMADNGVVHILDTVLWPPGLSEASFGERSPLTMNPNSQGSQSYTMSSSVKSLGITPQQRSKL